MVCSGRRIKLSKLNLAVMLLNRLRVSFLCLLFIYKYDMIIKYCRGGVQDEVS